MKSVYILIFLFVSVSAIAFINQDNSPDSINGYDVTIEEEHHSSKNMGDNQISELESDNELEEKQPLKKEKEQAAEYEGSIGNSFKTVNQADSQEYLYSETLTKNTYVHSDTQNNKIQISHAELNNSYSDTASQNSVRIDSGYLDDENSAVIVQAHDQFDNLVDKQTANENPISAEPVYDEYGNLVDEQMSAKMNCPDSLYMGGNAYAVNTLKRAGCPKPANYHGQW